MQQNYIKQKFKTKKTIQNDSSLYVKKDKKCCYNKHNKLSSLDTININYLKTILPQKCFRLTIQIKEH
jgi:hypothetical protein